MIKTIKLFFRYSIMSLKTAMEYKFDRVMSAIAVFVREMISVVVMYLILIQFMRIKDWEMNELFFLYSFLFISYSIFILFFTGIRDLDEMVYTGELDRFMTRPVGILTQVLGARADYCALLGHGTAGVLLFIYTSNSIGINWTPLNISYYVFAIIGGAIIQASIFMFSSCFSFWAVKTENIRNLLFFNTRRFAGYPITFYPIVIQKILIFIIPFAFVSYFPAQFFLDKPGIDNFFTPFLYLTPVVGIVMFLLVFLMWKEGLKRYSSTGNSVYS